MIDQPGRPTFDRILDGVSSLSGCDPTDICGSTRTPYLVEARSLVAYLCHRYAEMSFPQIAAAMGKPHHTTVLTGSHRTRAKLETCRQLLEVEKARNVEVRR